MKTKQTIARATMKATTVPTTMAKLTIRLWTMTALVLILLLRKTLMTGPTRVPANELTRVVNVVLMIIVMVRLTMPLWKMNLPKFPTTVAFSWSRLAVAG